jgi:hypothetical protein
VAGQNKCRWTAYALDSICVAGQLKCNGSLLSRVEIRACDLPVFERDFSLTVRAPVRWGIVLGVSQHLHSSSRAESSVGLPSMYQP